MKRGIYDFKNLGHVGGSLLRICQRGPHRFTHTTITMVLMRMGARMFLKVTTRYFKMDLEMYQRKIGVILSPARDSPGPDLCLAGKEIDQRQR